MDKAPFLDDLQQRLSALVEATPAADLQKNLKALLTQQFAELDLVTREEFDAQARVLARTREKLQELERRLTELETPRRCRGAPTPRRRGRNQPAVSRCPARCRALARIRSAVAASSRASWVSIALRSSTRTPCAGVSASGPAVSARSTAISRRL